MDNALALSTNIFSAEEPTLGYLYQITYSLLLLIQSSEIEDAKVAIEKLDDIVILEPDSTQVFQMKYHLNSVANLTDRSSDFWKTVRVWCTAISNGTIDANSTSLHLITTAPASEDSIAKEFTKDAVERELDDLVLKLNAIASETSNISNKPGYDAYNALSAENRKLLVSKIHVCDSSLGIEEIKLKIRSELRKTIIDEKVPTLFEHLLGWYLEKAIRNLLGTIPFISFKEYQAKCFEIIDALKIDNLPADFLDPVNVSGNELKDFQKRTFVKQLNIVGIQGRAVNSAISDYNRAFEQRSKWIRDGLIDIDEELKYERKLFDDWKRKFDSLMNVEADASVDHKIAMGKSFYENFYVINYPKIFIRERFDHAYMIIGSCHILSDSKRIGWHPEFEKNV